MPDPTHRVHATAISYGDPDRPATAYRGDEVALSSDEAERFTGLLVTFSTVDAVTGRPATIQVPAVSSLSEDDPTAVQVQTISPEPEQDTATAEAASQSTGDESEAVASRTGRRRQG